MAREMDLDRIQHSFQLTKRWFATRNLTTFKTYILPEWKDKSCHYLELGVFEGYSLCWMLQKVLLHPDSRAVGIDPHLITAKIDGPAMEAVMLRARHNIIPWKDRCQLIRGNSAEVLRKMLRSRSGWMGVKAKSVDLALVDGNHNALAVLDDLRLVIRLVRKGGWIVLDDVENDQKKNDHVKQGLAMFLDERGQDLELVFKHRYIETYKVLI